MIQILERSALRSARIGYCLVRAIDIVPAAQRCDGKICDGVVRLMAQWCSCGQWQVRVYITS